MGSGGGESMAFSSLCSAAVKLEKKNWQKQPKSGRRRRQGRELGVADGWLLPHCVTSLPARSGAGPADFLCGSSGADARAPAPPDLALAEQ